MQIFRDFSQWKQRGRCALALGNFDGVHLGHQALLKRLKQLAQQQQVGAAVMIFEPHPREYFSPEQAPARLTGLRDQVEAFKALDIDYLFIQKFNQHFANLSPEFFIQKILVQELSVKTVLVGDDFCFGAQRSGNVNDLVAAGARYDFKVEQMPTLLSDQKRISSSAVRSALSRADFEHAAHLLGRPYMISGRVIHGLGLGAPLGFPTINMRLTHHRPAMTGIFIVRLHGLHNGLHDALDNGLDSTVLNGVASLGYRPTVDDSGKILLETHLLDYDGNAYGQLVRVEFIKKLRDEQKFNDYAALQEAIAADVRMARHYFSHA